MVAQEEEWQLYAPEARTLEIPELPFKNPGVRAEDNPPSLVPSSGVIKARSHPHQPKTVLQSPQFSQVRIQKHLDRLLKHGIL
jgi:hypothetical protein